MKFYRHLKIRWKCGPTFSIGFHPGGCVHRIPKQAIPRHGRTYHAGYTRSWNDTAAGEYTYYIIQYLFCLYAFWLCLTLSAFYVMDQDVSCLFGFFFFEHRRNRPLVDSQSFKSLMKCMCLQVLAVILLLCCCW